MSKGEGVKRDVVVVSFRGVGSVAEVRVMFVRITFTDGGVDVLMTSTCTISRERLLALPYAWKRHRSRVSAHWFQAVG